MGLAATNRMLSFAKVYGNDMIKVLDGSGIYFPVMLVQACNESGYGTSYSATHRNNFFGISGGKAIFKSPYDCFFYYVNMLQTYHNYVNAGVGTASDPYNQIKAISDSGYYDANTDENLPPSQLPPNKTWTAAQSAQRYYNINKGFLDGILLRLPIGLINSQNASTASNLIASTQTT
jgi:hypothetical protein